MAQTQPFGFPCVGGLDVNKSSFNLQDQAGVATELINFEVDTDGGYRRINGCNILATTAEVAGRISTTEDNDGIGNALGVQEHRILGIVGYSDGGIVCSSGNVFYTPEGANFIRVNRSSVDVGGDDHSTFKGKSITSRNTPTELVDFTVYETSSQNNQVIICDGVNQPLQIRIDGTGALSGLTYFVNEIEIDTNTTITPTASLIHKDRMVAIGNPTTPNTVYYSSIIGTTAINFHGGSSGAFVLEDKVIGIRSFRETLILFCKNSIYKVANLGSTDSGTPMAVIPITKNIGCINKNTIQEIGGDLVFLAADGLRTLAGTERIDDTELGTISRPIQRLLLNEVISKANTLTISSVVIKKKNQYRLFYSNNIANDTTEDNIMTDIEESRGIVGTLTADGFQWSEIKGMQPQAIASIVNRNNLEIVYHGDKHGSLLVHETGSFFYTHKQRKNIRAEYKSPFLDLGDMGTQKTLTYVNLAINAEGPVTPTLSVTYGEENFEAIQPAPIVLPKVTAASKFGTAKFESTNIDFAFGALEAPLVRQAVQGSGNTIQVGIATDDQKSPFILQGVYMNYYPSGRR